MIFTFFSASEHLSLFKNLLQRSHMTQNFVHRQPYTTHKEPIILFSHFIYFQNPFLGLGIWEILKSRNQENSKVGNWGEIEYRGTWKPCTDGMLGGVSQQQKPLSLLCGNKKNYKKRKENNRQRREKVTKENPYNSNTDRILG